MAKMILLADDSPDDVAAVQLALKVAGVSNPVTVLDNGARVIAWLKGEGDYGNREQFPLPDVLLVDLNMPGVDGFDVLEWVKRESNLKHLLVVVLSGHHGVREINQAYALGANSFLFKPANPVEVKNLVQSFPEYWVRGGEDLGWASVQVKPALAGEQVKSRKV
jgi:CheY-like chemotaxis protein